MFLESNNFFLEKSVIKSIRVVADESKNGLTIIRDIKGDVSKNFQYVTKAMLGLCSLILDVLLRNTRIVMCKMKCASEQFPSLLD